METSKIPIIIIDDEKEYCEDLAGTAWDEDFKVIDFQNLDEGFAHLRQDVNHKYKALILDAKCVIHKHQETEDIDSLGEALDRLKSLMIRQERFIPTVVNTACKGEFINDRALMRQLKNLQIHVFDKVEDTGSILPYLSQQISKSDDYYATQHYPDIFSIFDKGHLVANKRKDLVKILAQKTSIHSTTIKTNLSLMRNLLEAMLVQITDIHFFDKNNRDYFKKNGALLCKNIIRKLAHDNLSNFTKYHKNLFLDIYDIACEYGSHHNDELPEKYVLPRVTYSLLELLTWFQKAMDEAS